MSEDQKDCDVTVGGIYEYDGECFTAELKIAGKTHDSLDEDHPVICVIDDADDNRMDDIEEISKRIGL